MVSILPDAFDCPDCGVKCEATVTHDPNMCERVDSWTCPDCEESFYRESDGEVHLRGVAQRARERFR